VKPTVYIETTIPSYLVAKPSLDLRLAADQATTLEWWEGQQKNYELFISAVVVREISKGDEHHGPEEDRSNQTPAHPRNKC
jgi:hypothetical protein